MADVTPIMSGFKLLNLVFKFFLGGMSCLAIHHVHCVPVFFQHRRQVTNAKWQKDSLRRFNWVWWIYKCYVGFHVGSPTLVIPKRLMELLCVLQNWPKQRLQRFLVKTQGFLSSSQQLALNMAITGEIGGFVSDLALITQTSKQ